MLGYLYDPKDKDNLKFVYSVPSQQQSNVETTTTSKRFNGVIDENGQIAFNEAYLPNGKKIKALAERNVTDLKQPSANPGEYFFPHTTAQLYCEPDVDFEKTKQVRKKKKKTTPTNYGNETLNPITSQL